MNQLMNLPHGARGFQFEDFAIELGNDKLAFIDRNKREHHTFHLGPCSGVLDVHRTWSDSEGLHHTTLFAIELPELVKALEALAQTRLLQGFLALYRPLRVGWLYRHKVTLVRGLEDMDDTRLAAVSVKAMTRS